jgi:hypothetical protein
MGAKASLVGVSGLTITIVRDSASKSKGRTPKSKPETNRLIMFNPTSPKCSSGCRLPGYCSP